MNDACAPSRPLIFHRMFKPLAFAALFLLMWLADSWFVPGPWKLSILPAMGAVTYVMRLLLPLGTCVVALVVFWLSACVLSVYELSIRHPGRMEELGLVGIGLLIWLLVTHALLETERRDSAERCRSRFL